MATEVVRGIVIHETMVGEADKIITILCKDKGKISVSAKGSRKPTNKNVSASSLFAYCDFNIYTGLKYYRLNSADIIKSFYKISYDYDKLIYANYLAEVCNKISICDTETNDILFLVINCINAMEIDKISPKLIISIFNIKLVQILGYEPVLDFCSVCGTDIEDIMYFGYEGIVCKKCNTRNYRFNDDVLYVIKFILETDIKQLFNFTVNDNNTDILYNIALGYLINHLDLQFKSLKLI